MNAYSEYPGVNWSLLKQMAKSPLAYKYASDNEREDKAHLAVGRYVHALVFEPQHVGERYAIHDGTFKLDYVVFEHGERRGKVWSAFKELHEGRLILKPDEVSELEEGAASCQRKGRVWDAFKAANPGKTLFTAGEAKAARNMAEAVRNHPLVRPYLDVADGVFEEVLQWTDPYTRLPCKARLDWHIRSRDVLLDLKTTKSIEMRSFGRDIANFTYHGQLAHYANGLEYARGWYPQRQIFVAVEKEPPHDVLVCVLDEEAKELARNTVGTLLERVAECQRTGSWPGRYTEEQTAQLPGWVFGGEPEIEFEGEDNAAH